MASSVSNINLVKSHKSYLERFLGWALTLGRVVIIATEGIALAAFLFRFGLDRQIVDLHDQINQKQAILHYLQKSENTYRNLQERLGEVSRLTSKLPPSILAFDSISQSIPAGIRFNNFTLTQDSIKIDADADSITALSSFISALKENKKISSLSLDQIQNRASSSIISFGINMQLK